MEVLLFIIGIVVFTSLLGSFFEHQDKAKEEERQREITKQAYHAMLSGRFLEKRDFHDGWAVVKLADYRFAYVNRMGKFLNNEIFTFADDFKQGTAVVRNYEKGIAIVNAYGVYVLPYNTAPKVETYIQPLLDGIYKYTITFYKRPGYVERKDIYVVKQSGEFINREPISDIIEIKDNYIKYKIGILTGEMDFSGRMISRPFREKEKIGSSLFKVMEEEYGWGVYDEIIDKIIIPCKYSEITYFEAQDLFIIQPFGDGKQSFPAFVVNRNNKVVIDPHFDFLSIFNDNYFEIGVANSLSKYGISRGIMDCSGRILVQPKYLSIWVSPKGNFMACEHKRIDSQSQRLGQVKQNGIANLEYSSFKSISRNNTVLYFIVTKNTKYGVIDLDNIVVLPFVYNSIKIVYKEKDVPFGYIVEKDNKFGVLDLLGNSIIPLSFNEIIQHDNDKDDDSFYDGEWFYKKTSYFEVVDINGNNIFIDLRGKEYKDNNLLVTKSVSDKGNRFEPFISNNEEKKKRFLFFDTETTGLPSDYNAPIYNTHNWPRLIQISWILTEEDANVVSQKNFIIKPNGFVIPEESSNIHRITTERAVAEGLDLSIVLDLFDNDLKQADIIVGHNIDFDIKVVRAEMFRLSREDCLVDKKTICTMKSTTSFCKIQGEHGYKFPKLQELYTKLFGHSFDNAHNSQADTLATMRCYFELCKRGIL